jgi:citrate lyase subunit beta/citryl-CoA lyase
VPGAVPLLFGSIDFQLDLGILGEDEALAAFRSQLVLASRLGGASAPIDGVTVGIENLTELESDVARARAFGFGGKLCVHLRQVSSVNVGFAPSPASRSRQKKILDIAISSPDSEAGVMAMDGHTIDRPIILQAKRILLATTTSRSDVPPWTESSRCSPDII